MIHGLIEWSLCLADFEPHDSQCPNALHVYETLDYWLCALQLGYHSGEELQRVKGAENLEEDMRSIKVHRL